MNASCVIALQLMNESYTIVLLSPSSLQNLFLLLQHMHLVICKNFVQYYLNIFFCIFWIFVYRASNILLLQYRQSATYAEIWFEHKHFVHCSTCEAVLMMKKRAIKLFVGVLPSSVVWEIFYVPCIKYYLIIVRRIAPLQVLQVSKTPQLWYHFSVNFTFVLVCFCADAPFLCNLKYIKIKYRSG